MMRIFITAVLAALAAVNAGAAIIFDVLPSGGNVPAQPGQTIGWGYSIQNDTADWIVPITLNASPFVFGTPESIFDFPILAPGASVSKPFNGLDEGLYRLLVPNDASLIGQSITGEFAVAFALFSDDPLLPTSDFLGVTDDFTAAFSTVVNAPTEPAVPEPASLLLMVSAGAAFVLLRRSH